MTGPAPAPALATAAAAVAAGAGVEDMLGLGGGAASAPQKPAAAAAAPKKAYSEKESTEAMFKIVEKFLILTAKDTPPGKEKILARMTNHYKVGKLQDLVHAQRVEFIEWVEALIAERN